MSGLHKGIRNGCAIEIFCGLFIVLILTQCSCMSAALPVEPVPASLVVKGVNTVIPTATQAGWILEFCPTIDTVNLRTGAGTGLELVVKGVNTPAVIPTAAELIREVCPHVGNVNLRKAADAESDILAVLKMGDTLTLTGELVIAPDMGLWWPVRAGELDGYINARYVCER